MIYWEEDVIYTNFITEEIEKEKSTKIRGIVVGKCGSGKTSIFNSLTNPKTKYPTGFSEGSLTIDIAYEDVFYEHSRFFRLYDTPGIDSAERTLELAQIIRSSLTSKPLNIIIINLKLDNRYANTIIDLKKLLNIFKGYEKIVVIMISHVDLLIN
jgi:predicted GTPase